MERITKIISTAIEKSEDSEFILGFIEGAKWADSNPFFIDVKEDLPCYHKEFINKFEDGTCDFFVALRNVYCGLVKYKTSHMFKVNNEWKWDKEINNYKVIGWKLIPKII